MAEREIVKRERASSVYFTGAYFLNKLVFDLIPLRIIPPIVLIAISYYMVGLNPEPDRFWWLVLIAVLFNLAAGSMNILIGTFAPTLAIANMISIIILLFNGKSCFKSCNKLVALFGGFLLNRKNAPNWIGWAQWLSVRFT